AAAQLGQGRVRIDQEACVGGIEVSEGGHASSRSATSNASGRTSDIVLTPEAVNSWQSGPPFSHSNCRQRPHGMTGRPCPSTHTTARSFPPPVECRAETMPHSAHRATPYAAFSTLQPSTPRPSSTRPAAPTLYFEYGAYARSMTSTAYFCRAAQSTGASGGVKPKLVIPHSPSGRSCRRPRASSGSG